MTGGQPAESAKHHQVEACFKHETVAETCRNSKVLLVVPYPGRPGHLCLARPQEFKAPR